MRRVLFAALLLLSGCNVVPVAHATDAARPTSDAGSAVYLLDHEIRGGESDQIRELVRWARVGHAKELVVIIDSEGGIAAEGVALYTVLRTAGLPTRCIVSGAAASAAFVALQGCTTRVAKKTAVMATHNPLIVLPNPNTILTVEMAEDVAKRIRGLADAYATVCAARMGMSVVLYQEKVSGGQIWTMNGAEALEAHAIDQVID